MAGNNGKIRQYRKPLNINLGIIIFSVIFIYIIICVFLYFTQKQIQPYEVKTGSLSVDSVYQGIALRAETVVESTDSGYINYYAREGERVGSGKLVCSVDESGELKEIFEAGEAEDGQLSEDDLEDIKSEVTGFMGGFDRKQFGETYDFKYTLEGTALKISNESVLTDLESLGGNSSFVTLCNAPESGIVVYSTDGYETLTAEQITAEMFETDSYQKNQLINNELVSTGDSIYKLVTDENWSIVIQTEEDLAQFLLEEEYVQVRFLKNQDVSWAEVSVIDNGDGNTYVKLDFNNSMITFCTDRFVDIELIMEEEEGLKVPNSAIAEKEFFLVPKDFVTKGANGADGVLLETFTEDGEAATEFIATTIYQETEEDYYIDNSILEVGDDLVKPDSTDTYTISRSAVLTGVYNINKGYADFKEIQILAQNDEYAIIKSNTTYGLSAYDRIVLDAETVNADELIF
ncbi:MAG TPA: hypothetical protein H9717_12300 [Candidatus Eisenbergiella merdipullorum]|uniref:RND related barrel-sandwich hybrid domain-containing protein n=1 Tax=Candidatus Eisenbergiella merdipullorum TaxID=2838553 RepID=A0A9D2I985_9FIRM|nr:hypothetical protein [Candidatus Eisenbergiella merdipullorum]